MKIFSTDKLLSLSFSGLVFLFFAFLYSFHLNYQEQFQMFLFTGDYFFGYIAKPGGFSDYIGNFFTQFFFYSWIGAIIIASLLTLLQRAVLWISKSLGANSLFIPLSFIPSILYWGLLLDENYLLGGVVVMLVVVAFICVYTLLKPVTSRAIFVLISIPILYWLVGGAFLLLPIFAIAQQIMRHELKKSHLVYFALGCALLSITLPIFCKYSFLQYPMSKVWLGANYYRFPVIIPFSVGLIGLLIIVIPFVLQFLSHQVKPKSPIFILAVQISVLLIGGYLFLAKMSDMKKEELMAYDFNVRMRKWDRVIKLADKKAPSSPLSVTCLNLALAKEGLLSDRMFYYYQNGVEGLLPDFTRDFTIPMIAGEVYYHLGFINTAQRYAFEAMEALPDYQKSVRSVMRLAETNLINGDYAVAEKYLHLLQNTFYYRAWAANTLRTMKDEKLIAQHSEYGLLRQFRTREDFLFSEGEKDMMLGVLFSQNKENKMAYEYLMAYCLLTKDLKHFMQYIPLGSTLNYKVIPNSYQEALMYVWEKSNNDPTKQIPYQVSPQIQRRVKSYERMNSNQNSGDAKLFTEFSNTYWYYLQFRK